MSFMDEYRRKMQLELKFGAFASMLQVLTMNFIVATATEHGMDPTELRRQFNEHVTKMAQEAAENQE